MACKFSIKTFDELTSLDVYFILQARVQIFLLEQKLSYQDIDEVDFHSLHLVAHKEGSLIGYTRIVPPVQEDPPPKKLKTTDPVTIDRMLMLPEHRGYGLAQQMLTNTLSHCKKYYPKSPIRMSVQPLMIDFYSPYGFAVISEPYYKNGAEFVDMAYDHRKKVNKSGNDDKALSKTLAIIMIVLGLLFIAGILYLMP